LLDAARRFYPGDYSGGRMSAMRSTVAP
jgi:hypothetical protein